MTTDLDFIKDYSDNLYGGRNTVQKAVVLTGAHLAGLPVQSPVRPVTYFGVLSSIGTAVTAKLQVPGTGLQDLILSADSVSVPVVFSGIDADKYDNLIFHGWEVQRKGSSFPLQVRELWKSKYFQMGYTTTFENGTHNFTFKLLPERVAEYDNVFSVHTLTDTGLLNWNNSDGWSYEENGQRVFKFTVYDTNIKKLVVTPAWIGQGYGVEILEEIEISVNPNPLQINPTYSDWVYDAATDNYRCTVTDFFTHDASITYINTTLQEADANGINIGQWGGGVIRDGETPNGYIDIAKMWYDMKAGIIVKSDYYSDSDVNWLRHLKHLPFVK